jgi:hypothetical protein
MAGFADNGSAYRAAFDRGETFSDNFSPTGPFHGVFAGIRSLASWARQTELQFVWSSSVFAFNNPYASALQIEPWYMYTDGYDLRSEGAAVRCLLQL